MIVGKIPEVLTIKNGWIQFSKGDNEIYYAVTIWNKSKSSFNIIAQGRVTGEAHLEFLVALKEWKIE